MIRRENVGRARILGAAAVAVALGALLLLLPRLDRAQSEGLAFPVDMRYSLTVHQGGESYVEFHDLHMTSWNRWADIITGSSGVPCPQSGEGRSTPDGPQAPSSQEVLCAPVHQIGSGDAARQIP